MAGDQVLANGVIDMMVMLFIHLQTMLIIKKM